MSTTAIIDRVIANLISNGAVTPHPTPADVAGDVALFLNNPTQLAPGAAPLVRFHRAMRTLTEHGKGNHKVFQRFFNWQHGFIARGLEVYFPQDDFIAYTRLAAPKLTEGPLPTLYNGLVQEHIDKASNTRAVASFPVAKLLSESDLPARGLHKESRGDLVRAGRVLQENPGLLLTSAAYQGLHLQFLQDTGTRLQETTAIPTESRAVIGEAVRRLATNIGNANFVRFALWTAIAYDKRRAVTGDATGPIAQQDFIAGWSALEKGGGFSTQFASTKPAETPGGKTSSVVVCPYHKIGRSLAAQEVCAPNGAEQPSITNTKAFGLWCLHTMLGKASDITRGPHRNTLVYIAENIMPQPVVTKSMRQASVFPRTGSEP